MSLIMPITKDSRYVTTAELFELNTRATEFGASRVLDQYEMLNLDPDGIHTLTPIYLVWTPFRRCEVALKVAGDPFPHSAVLDLQDHWYDALPKVGDYVKALDYYEKNPRRAQ